MAEKERASRNRTILLTDEDRRGYGRALRHLHAPASLDDILDSTICQDVFGVLDFLPQRSFDLVFADPPYNMTKNFSGVRFQEMDAARYREWLASWLPDMRRLLKPNGSIYVCGDWRSSAAIQEVLEEHFIIRNRITWEREKGRGAKNNWKNNSEDIWFATVSEDYVFEVDAVMAKRRVIAPYTDGMGRPKDWHETADGRYRLTHPSNIWTDLTVPFWSMPENTDHPTQKPEKLVARAILASSNEGGIVLDPFLGSGTTSVVAKKLRRHYVGIEIDRDFCCLAEKRLILAEKDASIQGYADGAFWDRNTLSEQSGRRKGNARNSQQSSLFDALDMAE